jgi:hypothetical protein
MPARLSHGTGTSLEQATSSPPPWLRGNPSGRERLKAAAKAAARDGAAPAASSTAAGAGTPPPPQQLQQQQQQRRRRAPLNASQARAVETALGRTLTLWQGPPGTGKTATLLRFCEAALAALPPGGQVLAVAASNVAVDNLVSGLVELGIRVARVGQPVKVRLEGRGRQGDPGLRLRRGCLPMQLPGCRQHRGLGPAVSPASLRLCHSQMPKTWLGKAWKFRSKTWCATPHIYHRQVSPELRGVTVEALSAATPPGERAAALRRRAASAPASEAGALWRQAMLFDAEAAALVLTHAQVVAATCIGAGEGAPRATRLPCRCWVDKATRKPEDHQT